MNRREMARERRISDPAYRTWVVAEGMGYRGGKCTQGEVAEVRGISRETANRHLKEVRGVTKVSHPYIVYKRSTRRVPVDAWDIRREVRGMAEADRRVAAHGYHCRGLGCLGIVARLALDEPLESHRAEEFEVMGVRGWERAC